MNMQRRAISQRQRFRIFERDGYTCFWCGRSVPNVVLEADHIVAVADGGDNDDENLVAACQDCNNGKSKSRVALGKLGGGLSAPFRIVWDDGSVTHKRRRDLTIRDYQQLARYEERIAARHRAQAQDYRAHAEMMNQRGLGADEPDDYDAPVTPAEAGLSS